MKTNHFKSLILLFLIIPLLISCDGNKNKRNSNVPECKAKYIFFFIGDGMSNQHVNLAEAYLMDANESKPGFQKLAFDTLPVLGMITTYANNRLITGSAAAGTAMATGNKTNLKRISKSPDGKENYKSIAYQLKEKGFKIGIISTVSIDHATPAVFYANQDHRTQYFEIGKQLAESNFEFFGGGGFKDPVKDDIDLYKYTEQKSYQVIRSPNGIEEIDKNRKIMLVNPVLHEDADMPYSIDRKFEGGYSLAEITSAAIDHLYNEDGFFIMVESGKIDWASHNNDAATIAMEVIDFDRSIQEALNFYKEHPDETLIIITADHETGGLSLGTDSPVKKESISYLSQQKMSYSRVERLLKKGEVDNTDLGKIFGVDDPNSWEQAKLALAMNPQLNPDKYKDYDTYMPLPITYLQIVNARAGVDFSTWEHTSAEVPVFVIGKGQDLFAGKYDNTDIPNKIMKASGE